ncbi:nucleotide-binding universal stress UspA family protein [Isoptericola sp. CG 20/1183]|uniref:Nucleotide-binding universal stress UspA family protein n=1 Tax=Isoptericola halotolerans TaxID=300560 RepID=A0ABX5EA05_9MICO|nr:MULTISPECIES: universal stress protein [Isoptericola]PRZ03208.1 nucleotide-binding universal stress UspA family protein [Isoptericola sp. CG 20/1183]PRZ03580.1 nucleotide-binding universal stress UspA family protein [Isoptericola halotolerans]
MTDISSDLPIVVGVDGSPEAARALEFAVQQARRDHCSLSLVCAIHEVVPIGPMLPLIAGDSLLDVGRQLLVDARDLVEEASDGAVGVRLEVALGPAVDLLAAASDQARLVVLGHRSLSLVERVFTGSTTFGVAARADCPVVSVPLETDLETPRHRVVAAIDGSPGSAHVLAQASSAAAQRSATLEVLHCWRLNPFYSYLVDEWSVQEEWGKQTHAIIDGLVEEAARAHPGLTVETHLEYAEVADTLVRRSAGADLMVLGRHGHGGPGARMVAAVLGAVTRAVLQHAPCPVEVVPARRHRAS